MNNFEKITINRRIQSIGINFATDSDSDAHVKLLLNNDAEGKVNNCKIETLDFTNKWFQVENIREWKIKIALIDEALDTILELKKRKTLISNMDIEASIHIPNQE